MKSAIAFALLSALLATPAAAQGGRIVDGPGPRALVVDPALGLHGLAQHDVSDAEAGSLLHRTPVIHRCFVQRGSLNPAGASRQLVGVPRPELTELVARSLAMLGAERAWVVHGADGLDEIAHGYAASFCAAGAFCAAGGAGVKWS